MLAMFLVFLGGGIGSAGRYLISDWGNGIVQDYQLHSRPQFWGMQLLWPQFPLGTLLVNILGSFLLGFAAIFYRQYVSSTIGASTTKSLWQSIYIPLFFTGFCGGFTTFSSYMLDVYNQFLAGDFLRAWLLLSLHIGLGLISAGLGVWLGWQIGGNLTT